MDAADRACAARRARRYSDLRASCRASRPTCWPTGCGNYNDAGIVNRTELPRPVYSLSDIGWRRVVPIVQSIACVRQTGSNRSAAARWYQ